ncbi:MAG: radical SAM protein [Chloroflexi bacterium]|nr:radical SAM protein [Chloroflexota bacterium]
MSVDVLIVEDLARQKLPARSMSAAFQREGLRVHLVDLNDGYAAIIASARAESPGLIIFSILFADRVDEHLALITLLRAAGLRAHFALIGHLPTLACTDFLAACPTLDSVLRGDAEACAPDLARCLASQGEWQTVPGIALRSSDPLSNFSPRENISLDDFPRPLREEPAPCFRGYPFATIESSRGCYHACSFCLPAASYRAQGMPYRQREVAKIVDEIEELYRRGVRLFLFDDDQFLPPGLTRVARVEEFAVELERKNLTIAFTIKCRADDVEASLFRRLKELGLLRVYLGVESGCPATLELFNKRTTVQQNAAACAMLENLGIVFDFRCLLFHPWSTLETVAAEIDFLQAMQSHLPTALDVREIEIYPGTPLARQLGRTRAGVPTPGLMPYTIADPRAEFLRRVSRLVFDSQGAYGRTCRALTEDWCALLLTRRFHRELDNAGNWQKLRGVVTQLNVASLQVWGEMLEFARARDIYDATRVNAQVGDWAMAINSACAPIAAVSGRSSVVIKFE